MTKDEITSRIDQVEADLAERRTKAEVDIIAMYMDELEAWVISQGFPKFRAKQIWNWIHVQCTTDPDQMLNLPKDMREVLKKHMLPVVEELHQTSKMDGTVKHLFRMHDGQMIETVYMPFERGNSICISSQAGCPMGCSFCASTIGGWKRNLTASEMLSQVYNAIKINGERVSNVVVMGTGEPLLNLDNLTRFIKIITDENGYNMSVRNITVSTCGIVPGIYTLAESHLPVTLALSLHAPTDEERKEIMPVAHKYTIAETLEACMNYFKVTGRRITIEYSLMEGVNDTAEVADKLGHLLKGDGFHVNLIPINPVTEREFVRSSTERVQRFKNRLEKYRINVTIRRSMGGDIDAACGQLRRKYED